MPARLGLRRTGRPHYRPQIQPHLWPSVFRAGPTGLPCYPQATARRCTLPARSGDNAALATHHNRARQLQLRFVRGCHEGCSRFQTQELLSAVPPRCRFPLTREPSAHGSPPPHRKSGCRRRHTARPSAARCTEDNSVLCPETSPRLSRSLLAAGCPDPAPPPATQCARQSLRHPSRQPRTPLV